MKPKFAWIETAALLIVPAALVACTLLQLEQTALLSMAVLICALGIFLVRYERRKLKPRDIMPIVVLSAVAVAGRVLFTPLPNFQPVSAIVIIAALCFGRESGFLTGALSALVSNMFLGQGAWTPWQMYGWGMMGYFAGMMEARGFFRKNWVVYLYGFFISYLFGTMMDFWYLVGFISPVTLENTLLTLGAGIPFNLSHAVSTVLFLLLTLGPWRKKMLRVKRKFGLLEEGETAASR